MPRPNRARSIASEDNLARRITYERERKGWSYAGLAQRMTEKGCAIDQSALYKIEKGNPRRRISVDELVALQEVFGIAMNALLAPPEFVAKEAAVQALEEYRQARAAYHNALQQLVEISKADPRIESVLNDLVTAEDIPWAEIHYGMRLVGDAFEAEHGRPMTLADMKAAHEAVYGAGD
jgi:transcriptional regulator with XRE-family HTH domain